MAVTGIDETRLRRAFLEEAEELSQKLGETLLALEGDPGNAQVVNEVFRLTHSLKSEAALMGFTSLSTIAHRMEDVLGLAREGRLSLDKAAIDRFFAGSDLIAEMMSAIAKGGSDADFDTAAVLRELSVAVDRASGAGGSSVDASGRMPPGTAETMRGQAVHGAAGGMPPGAAAQIPTGAAAGTAAFPLTDFERGQLAEARDRGEALYRLVVNVDESEPMKFPRAYLVFANLELVSNVIRVVPPMDPPSEDNQYAQVAMLLTGGDEQSLRSAATVDQIAGVTVERCGYDDLLSPVAARPRQPGSARAETGEAGAGPAAGGPAAAGPAAANDEMPRRSGGAVERTSIRVDTRKLDDLWSLIAELVLHKSHIARLSEELGRGADVHTIREELAESFDSLDKISSGMQQAMMDTRMIPISVIFNKFPRLVRDLSRKLGKSVELVLSGEDTEIDRSVVEVLSDPLTHIIRNSLDHGIEFPEERVRRGKSDKGRVQVSARRQGGTIMIELSDDGRGIDTARIREKALAMGIENASALSESQLLDLVFRPGFSTKEVVTDLSGRGVGMDVVATRIREDLKGSVELRTEAGRGTRVTLLLPLTLTIVNALLVRGQTQLYAIPLTDLDSTAKIAAVDIRVDEGREVCRWQDEDLPVYSLAALFASGRPAAAEYFAAVLRHGERRALLAVDELIEEREVVIKPVDDLLNSRRLFSGVSVLEDGRLVFILDTSFLRRDNF